MDSVSSSVNRSYNNYSQNNSQSLNSNQQSASSVQGGTGNDNIAGVHGEAGNENIQGGAGSDNIAGTRSGLGMDYIEWSNTVLGRQPSQSGQSGTVQGPSSLNDIMQSQMQDMQTAQAVTDTAALGLIDYDKVSAQVQQGNTLGGTMTAMTEVGLLNAHRRGEDIRMARRTASFDPYAASPQSTPGGLNPQLITWANGDSKMASGLLEIAKTDIFDFKALDKMLEERGIPDNVTGDTMEAIQYVHSIGGDISELTAENIADGSYRDSITASPVDSRPADDKAQKELADARSAEGVYSAAYLGVLDVDALEKQVASADRAERPQFVQCGQELLQAADNGTPLENIKGYAPNGVFDPYGREADMLERFGGWRNRQGGLGRLPSQMGISAIQMRDTGTAESLISAAQSGVIDYEAMAEMLNERGVPNNMTGRAMYALVQMHANGEDISDLTTKDLQPH
ncbi:MAG: hypothetical protein Q4F00_06395 [bacterium]|nr:hypothetical protein [bacterium]